MASEPPKKREFKVWPDPQPGKNYGPSAKQKLLFIESLPLVDTFEDGVNIKRPHLHPLDVVCYIGGARSGKCLGLNTPILMFDGSIKPVQNIKVGDLLMGPDSKSRLVKSLARGREKMYRVVPNRGEPWTCNESHILSLKISGNYLDPNTHQRFSHGETRNIELKNYLLLSNWAKSVHKLYKSENIKFFKNPELGINPYFLGIFLGDGTSREVSITTEDLEIERFIETYAKSLDLQTSKISVGRQTGSTVRINIHSGPGRQKNSLLEKFRAYNLINNKHIPKDFLFSSIENRLDLLAGILDTDGSLQNGLRFNFVQKNKRLFDEVVFLARSLGFSVRWKPFSWGCFYKDSWRSGQYYRATITGDTNRIPTLIKRKQAETLNNRRENVLHTGFKLEDIGIGDYYGFEIEGPDRLFLLGDFTVTHNTVGAVARNYSVFN